MTSRRYSELSNASNMSLIDEGDENSTPVVDANNTPRAKIVPSKRTRVSESPLTSLQQNSFFKGGDKNLEETFVEQPSVLASPLASKIPQQTSSMDVTQKGDFAFVDKNLEETFVEQSFFATPSVATATHQSPAAAADVTQKSVSFKADDYLEETFSESCFIADAMNSTSPGQTPTSEVSQRSVSFKVDKHLEETYVEPSALATPSHVKSALKTPATDNTQKSVSFDVNKSFDETIIKPSFFATPKPRSKKLPQDIDDVLQEEKAVNEEEYFTKTTTTVTSSSEVVTSAASPKRLESDVSVLGGSMVSFLEEEMQVYAEDKCKCVRFESIIKEYTILREKFVPKPNESANTTFKSNDEKEDEMFKIQEELVNLKIEVENYKKAADVAKKEADDFQFVLDEEKRRAKNRIADLQKENFALSDELESVKLGGGGDANATQENVLVNELQEQLAQLKDEFTKANNQIEEYKTKAEHAQKEADNLQVTLMAEKESLNNQLTEFQNVKDAEIETLKAAIADSLKMKDELSGLREKLQIFDAVVKQGFEVEEICKQLKADMNVLEKEKATKDAEIDQLKEDFVKQSAEIVGLNDQVFKSKVEAEECKAKAENAQKEIDALSAGMETYVAELKTQEAEIQSLKSLLDKSEAIKEQFAELETQKNAEIQSIKAELVSVKADLDVFVNEKSALQSLCDTKDVEFNRLKDAFDKEETRLQEELARLNDQCSKANYQIEEYKSKAESAQKEAESLQVALTVEKKSTNTQLTELQSQKDAEIESLKASFNVLESEKSELCSIRDEKEVELNQLKETLETEKAHHQEELEKLNNLLTKSTDEIEAYKVAAESATVEANKLQASLNKGKEFMNAKLAELKSQKDAEIESVKAEINVLVNEKAALRDLCTSKDIEFDQLKNSVAEEKARLQEELAQCNAKLVKANEEKEKLNKKVDKLYDDLDAADTERKELSETIFDLQSKLAKYGAGGDVFRGVINMGEVVSPNQPTSPDTSFKSVTEEPQPSSSAAVTSFKEENDITTPTKSSSSKDTPKRKQSFGAKIASPFRRVKKEQSQTPSKKDDVNSTCTTQ